MKGMLPILASLGLVACATAPTDNTPQQATAVLDAEYTINGKAVPNMTGKQKVLTRADQRSIRDTIKFDNIMMRWANMDEADIALIPKNKALTVDYKGKKYSECPLEGCKVTSFMDQFEGEEADEGDYQSYEELACEVNLVTNDFNVEKTGKSRTLNGFNVDEYRIEWKTEYADASGKKDLNLITFDFWNTQPNASLHEVWKVHDEFQTSLTKNAPNHPLIQLLGENGYKALAAFTGDLNSKENPIAGPIGKKLGKVQGYPISIKLEWVRKVEACQPERKAYNDKIDLNDGLENAGKQLLGNLTKKGTDALTANWRKQPLVRYVYEVKSANIQPIRDSQFMVPEGYKLKNRI